jgi:hypothetical protein
LEGKVLGFNHEEKVGVIKDPKGERYNFSLDDWKSDEQPKQNLEVDFIVGENGKATDIYVTSKSILSSSTLKNANEKLSQVAGSFGEATEKISSFKEKVKENISGKQKSKINKSKAYNIFALGLIIVVILAIFLKNHYATEAFRKELRNHQENLVYTKVSCNGLFSTSCTIKNLEYYEGGVKNFIVESLTIKNVAALADLDEVGAKKDIDVGVDIDNIKFETGLIEGLMGRNSQDGYILDYIFTELNKENHISINGLATVANGKMLHVALDEISYQNNLVPISANLLVENISTSPHLKQLKLDLKTNDITKAAYKVYSEAFLNNAKEDEIINFHRQDLKVCKEQLTKDDFKKSFEKMIAFSDIDYISDIFFERREGFRLGLNEKNNMSYQRVILAILSGNLNFNNFFEFEAYGKANPMAEAQSNSIITERSRYLKELGVDEAVLNTKKDKKENLSKQLGNYVWGRLPEPTENEATTLNNEIFASIETSTKEKLIQNFDTQYKCYKFHTALSDGSQKKALLNNKEYTIADAYSQLLRIKRQSPERVSSALDVVVENFTPVLGVDKDFFKKQLQSTLEENKYFKYIVSCYPYRRFDFIDYSASKSMDEKLGFIKQNVDLIRRVDSEYYQKWKAAYDNRHNLWKKSKREELDMLLVQYEELNKEISSKSSIVRSVNNCKDVKCLERLKLQLFKCEGDS